MGSRYLTEMPGVLRAAGLTVIEEHGHETRGRSSGGYDFDPFAAFWHHTASADGNTAGDISYMTYNADAAPVTNAYVDDDGVWYWLASGATNTQGKGDGGTFSRGVIPVDQANTHGVGVECRNNGVGERWPQVQIDSIFTGMAAINAALGNQPTDVMTHTEWTDRKIDPATAAAVEGPWQPGSVTSSGTWSNADLVAEFARRAGTLPPTNPPTNPPSEEDEMKLYIGLDDSGSVWAGDGIHRRSVTGDAWAVMFLRSSSGAGPQLISACGNGEPIRDISDLTCHLDHNGLDSLGKVAEDA